MSVNANEAMHRIMVESTAALEPYARRVMENLERVGRLIRASIDDGNEDILRAAVVFLHAAMEDCLRSIAGVFLPSADEEVLNRIPLSGNKRPEKFSLGRLSLNREKTVADVIRESVNEHLRHTSFNSVTQIVELLESIDFTLEASKSLFGDLETMMKRRHQIVHRADHDESDGLAAIQKDLVERWAMAVCKFISQLLAQVTKREAIRSADAVITEMAREGGSEV